MYSLSMSAARSLENATVMDQNSLIQQMYDDGLALKKHVNPVESNGHLLIQEDEEENSETSFLKSLTKKQKKALLKYDLI